MIASVAIISSVLAALSDESPSDAELEEVFHRALLLDRPRMFCDALQARFSKEEIFHIVRRLMVWACDPKTVSYEEYEKHEEFLIDVLDHLRHVEWKPLRVNQIYFKVLRYKKPISGPEIYDDEVYDITFLDGPTFSFDGRRGPIGLVELLYGLARTLMEFCETSVFPPERMATRKTPPTRLELKMLDNLIEDACSLTHLEINQIINDEGLQASNAPQFISRLFNSEKTKLWKRLLPQAPRDYWLTDQVVQILATR